MQTQDRPVVKINLSDINAKVYNVRGQIDPKSCVDLASRIRAEGLNNPVQIVQVTPEELEANDNKPYRLFAGFRRFLAHRINGSETIDARIYDGITVADEVLMNLTENVSRQDLTLMQEARGLAHLQKIRSMTQKEISLELNKSLKWVQVRLWALELEAPIQKEIEAGVLRTQHIEQLKALPAGESRFAYVRQLKTTKLTGEKPRVSLTKKKVFSKRRRERPEIFEMQDHILWSVAGGSFAKLPDEAKLVIQFLGWAAGEATDMEVYATLRKMAERLGRTYEIPESAMSALQS